MHISADEAIWIIDNETDYLILDVRAQEEYDEEHIPGAVLIPDHELKSRAARELPRKDQVILVYCRSGRRAQKAEEILEGLGYTQVREFGGIMNWPYETE